MGGVLDHRQAETPGYLVDRIQVGRQPRDMDRHDRPGAPGDRGLKQIRAHVETAFIDVHQHWSCVEVADYLRSSSEGVGRRDHLITALEADRLQRQVHGRGARVDRNGVSGADGRGKLRLELVSLWAGSDPA